MKRIGAVLLIGAALAMTAGCSSTATQKLGGTVYVDSGGGPTPAGVTRSDFDQIAKAGAANDNVGLRDLAASGVVVMVPACAPAILIDTAFGGERQVRVQSTGDAVWVDANWIKSSSSDCS